MMDLTLMSDTEYYESDNPLFKEFYVNICDEIYTPDQSSEADRDRYFSFMGELRLCYHFGFLDREESKRLSDEANASFGYACDGKKYDIFAEYDGKPVADTGNRYEDYLEGLIDKALDDIEAGRLTGDRERHDKYEELDGMFGFICGWQLGSTQPDPYSPRPTDTEPSEHNSELHDKIRKIW